MISELITRIKSSGTSNLLQRYLTGMASTKMARRLNNEALSKPFLNCLKGLDTSRFPDVVCDTTDLDRERYNPLLSALRITKTRTSIPNLREQAEAASNGTPFDVYTDKTKEEFHNILCEILHDYTTSMTELAKYYDPKQSADLQDFRLRLYEAAISGNALLHLARSSAIEKHLQAIEHLLGDFRRNKADDTRMVEEDEIDDDLRSVQPSAVHDGQVIPLWESYLKWLRLMVSHFDATSILTQYIKHPDFQYNRITIKIITPPRVDKCLLTWEQLLQSKYFPEPQLTDVSTDTIIEFLKEWSDSEKEAQGGGRSIDQILKTLKGPFDPSTTIRLTEDLVALGSVGSSGWKAYIKNMVELLTKHRISSTVQEVIPDIIGMLETLRDNSLLFKMLRKAPLGSGKNFTGAIHCEALLALLIILSRTKASGPIYEQYREILNELRVRYPISFSPLRSPLISSATEC